MHKTHEKSLKRRLKNAPSPIDFTCKQQFDDWHKMAAGPTYSRAPAVLSSLYIYARKNLKNNRKLIYLSFTEVPKELISGQYFLAPDVNEGKKKSVL